METKWSENGDSLEIFKNRGKGLMIMLSGTHKRSVDDKGRIILPVAFKEDLGFEFIITAGFEDTLMIMSKAEFDKFRESFERSSPSQRRKLNRYFVGNMHKASMDKQGRMQIPQPLRERVGLGDEVYVVGNGDNAEIWTIERWETESLMLNSDSISAAMDDIQA